MRDRLHVQLRSAHDTILANLACYSNLDAGTDWVRHAFDVSAWRGATVRVYLYAVEQGHHRTTFAVDDFALEVT